MGSLNDDFAIKRAWIGSHAASGYRSRQRDGSAVSTSRPSPAGVRRVTVLGGNGEPALGIEYELRDAAEDEGRCLSRPSHLA